MTEPPQPKLQTPSAAEIARLSALAAFLKRAQSAIRFVDYEQAERDCARLACKLRAALSATELASLRFVGVPRGGQIVLGMLSYWLGLEPRQLWPEGDSEAPRVLVDDCALTGARLHQALDRSDDRTVAIGLLYAPSELCRAVVEQTPGLRLCLAAHELADRSPEVYPDPEERRRWRAAWRERLGDGRYWVGLAELVSFAWSEPDRLFWNPVTERVENGWRFVPPDRCLKNRARPELPPSSSAARRWRVDPTLVTGSFDQGLLLYLGRSEQVFRLDGVAAQMWHALAAWGEPTAVIDYLAGEYEVGRGELRRDLDRFVDSLLSNGLLQRVDE